MFVTFIKVTWDVEKNVPTLAFYACVHSLECVLFQSYHHRLLWSTKTVVGILLLLTWYHKRFGSGGLFLVAHISTCLFRMCTLRCELVCLLISRKSAMGEYHWMSLCSCRVVVELLLDVAICCWSEVVKMRAHLWEIHPGGSSGFESTAREMAFINPSDSAL